MGSGESAGDTSAREEIDPFFLRELFPDAQGLLNTDYAALEEIKDTCLVVLDASAMLLPYVMGQITLGKVVEVYRPLGQQGRLIVPAQAAREFARNRATKIADIVRHLQDRASAVVAPMKQHIGILADDKDYIEVQKLSEEVGKLAKSIQAKVRAIVDRIGNEVGRDPVSEAYREVFKGCVRDENEPADQAAFLEEMTVRYAARRPPGYKDKAKSDGGAGDLIIWQSLLRASKASKRGCIFVTADTKTDWYTQANGAFQPRLELIEEYRLNSDGGTLHIIPLSRLMELYGAGADAVADTRSAEQAIRMPPKTVYREFSREAEREDEWLTLMMEQEDVKNRIEQANEQLETLSVDDLNPSLSLPWNRAAHGLRHSRSQLVARHSAIQARIREIEAGA